MESKVKPDLYLINGPLGAGKTTFLKAFLALPDYQDARVIENEFANTSIDTEQLHDHHAEVQTIAGVCICCSTGDELTDALELLSTSAPPVVIEATGMANSLRLIEKIVNADMLDKYTLRHTLFILDAAEASEDTAVLLKTYRHELQAADTVLISKTDLLTPDSLKQLMNALQALNLMQLSFVHEGVFEPSLLKPHSNTLAYFAQLNEQIENHDTGVSYTVIDTSGTFLETAFLSAVWEKIQKEYGIRRMKGNFQTSDGAMWHLEATPGQCKVTTYETGLLRFVIIGDDALSVTLKDLQESNSNDER